jgi:hypothetical protein
LKFPLFTILLSDNSHHHERPLGGGEIRLKFHFRFSEFHFQAVIVTVDTFHFQTIVIITEEI